jgi:hypothetical protein
VARWFHAYFIAWYSNVLGRRQPVFAFSDARRTGRSLPDLVLLLVLLPLTGTSVRLLAANETNGTIDFNQQIRPLLSDNCFQCHGPDEEDRYGGFRLDLQESALGEADSGERPIVPGDPDASEVMLRITADDDMQMPPPDSNKSLTPEEIGLIRQWIEQGAPWAQHWSFVPPKLSLLPKISHMEWPRNEVDHFVLARLEQQGLVPAAEADKHTLIRRLCLDLTGLPPTLEQVDAFLADSSDAAYENLVDSLLDSKHYGEHMARFWLDAARYGDTHGLHLDNYREMWPYRDWVIRAFNQNMPFDQFTIEQLAGDLLDHPTEDQLIATGFNRCNVTTNEGGSIEEEVYVRNVVDRVVTTGTVFMAATLDCTRCHDHKYDPYTMKDFYSMFGYFNSLDGSPMDANKKDPAPALHVLSKDQQQEIAQLESEIQQVRQKIQEELAGTVYQEPADQAAGKRVDVEEEVIVDDDLPPGVKDDGGWKFVTAPLPVFSGEKSATRTATELSQHLFQQAEKPWVIAEDQILFTHVFLDPENPPQEIMLQWNDGSWEHRAYWGENKIDWGKDNTPSRKRLGDLPELGKWVRLEIPVSDVGLKPGAKVNGWAFTQYAGTVYWDKAGVVQRTVSYESQLAWEADQTETTAATLPKPIQELLKVKSDDRSAAQQKQLQDYFVEHVWAPGREKFSGWHQAIKQAEQRIASIRKASPTTLIFRERKEPRPSFILKRGEYDQRGDEVSRATPASMPPLPEELPNNRLGLARWLVSGEHPLTARVTVNRLWQQVFGTGLVKTAEDFGSQGDVPSHPQLLDWLAVTFTNDGWDVKRMMRRLVMSATYRQTSQVPPENYRRDPGNRMLARGPRLRLDAESLRDQALAVSGLLVDRIGGPSVKPPQPDGLWFAVGYSGSDTVRFKADEGPDKVHRRTLYTFIKRTSPPPQLSTFDAPSREACSVRRERTNTPLQALLVMNDPQFVEPAVALAGRAMDEAGDEVPQQLVHMFRLCTCRQPTAGELEILVSAYRDHLSTYQEDEESARQLLAAGTLQVEEGSDLPHAAALAMVGNLLLNLDEVIMKN